MYNRNVPQLVIQMLYIQYSNDFDIFVFTAMFFSVLSAFIGLCRYILLKIRNQKMNGLCKLYVIKIECNLLRNYHSHTHYLLSKCICDISGIDSIGNIDIFYIKSIHHGILAFMEVNARTTNVLRKDISNSIFKRIKEVGEDGSRLNQLFIRVDCEIKSSDNTATAILSILEHQFDSVINFLGNDKAKFSVFKNVWQCLTYLIIQTTVMKPYITEV